MFLVYKPKGTRVKADQITLDNVGDMARMLMGRVRKTQPDFEGVSSVLGIEYPTFEGIVRADVGSWIVQDTAGVFVQIMTDEEFTSAYERARNTASED